MHLPAHVAGAALCWGRGGGSFQLPPLSTLLSKQEQAIQTHTPNGRLAGRVLLRATSCVCVCVLLGVCSSNKGKQCVLHCLIRWLCSALSAFLISVCVCRCCGGAGWLLDCGSSGERRFRDGPHLCLRTISMQ